MISGAQANSSARLVLVVAMAAATLAPAVAKAKTPARSAQAESRLWDESGRLSQREKTGLERRLAIAARRLGGPVFVLVAKGHGHESPAELAARAFAAHSLGADEASNPVLLLVSERDRAAAIETGKGNAGIVPEIDAQQITKRLAASRHDANLAGVLSEAIDAIVVSAEATAARRRPSPVGEDLPPPDPAPVAGRAGAAPSVGAPADEAVGDSQAPTGEQAGTPPPAARSRSRLPIAVGIAVLVLLALAIRRRKDVAASKEKRFPPPRPPASRPP